MNCPKSAYTILGYDGPEMRRDVYLMMVAFWTSVPLFAVSLAVSLSRRDLVWPGEVLWVVVLASSAYLTVRLSPSFPRPREGEGSESPAEARQTLETLVYPIVFVFSCSLLGFQIFSLLAPIHERPSRGVLRTSPVRGSRRFICPD